MSQHRPAVSVVIPMLNAGTTVDHQLTALSAQTEDREFEVVVADNGSTDSSISRALAFSHLFPRFQVVDASQVRGVSHARNVGAEVGGGDVILYTDADDVVCPGWVDALATALEGSDVVGGPLDEEAINPDYARAWGDPPTPLNRFNVVSGFLPNARGNNMGIHRSVLERIGGWNETYLFAEDVELSWRAITAGFTLTFVPEAVVQYRRRQTISTLARQQLFRGRQTHRMQLAHDFGAFGYRTEHDAVESWNAMSWVFRNVPASFVNRARRGMLVGKLSYGLGWALGTPSRRRLRRRL